ncbi:MAG: peptidase C14 [Blastocatellia bacterium AA13]|nr:MAG: peptidase C14 [Blastocatellia bacterium AA13]
MIKRALLVGIDQYDCMPPLRGCVNDVNALFPLLARNEDNLRNFHCEVRTSAADRVDRHSLLNDIKALFAPGADVALLYYAGHGEGSDSDVAIATQDGKSPELGITLSSILGTVRDSTAQEVVIILDCCYAGGAAGLPQLGGNVSALRNGLSILSACRKDQSAAETKEGRGLFSSYLCGALDGGAADVMGKVTIANIFGYLSESFGAWGQRPTFKTSVDRLHELRRCAPWVPIAELRRLPEIFPEQDGLLRLDPSYEPSAKPGHPDNEATFAILQRFRSAKLLEPVGADHLYFAAMQKKKCRLTPLGKLYWLMAKKGQF